MIVSCLCPTYNRYPSRGWLVEEAVESFLRQDYPRVKELVILNDTPGQILVCEAPGVRVVNVPMRYTSLGEKRNALVDMAEGDILLPWDDDDISLPGRIFQTVSILNPCRAAGGFGTNVHGYFNPGASWYLPMDGGPPRRGGGYCHNSSAFTREAWVKAGGYPETSGNEDAIMDGRLRKLPQVPGFTTYQRAYLPPEEWQYIYRWGVSDRHLSGVAGGPPEDPHSFQYAKIGEIPIQEGVYTITPRWRRSYDQLLPLEGRQT